MCGTVGREPHLDGGHPDGVGDEAADRDGPYAHPGEPRERRADGGGEEADDRERDAVADHGGEARPVNRTRRPEREAGEEDGDGAAGDGATVEGHRPRFETGGQNGMGGHCAAVSKSATAVTTTVDSQTAVGSGRRWTTNSHPRR